MRDNRSGGRRVVGRRRVLAALGAGVLLAGCRDHSPTGRPRGASAPLDPRLDPALAREASLITAYDAAIAAAPQLATALRALRRDHERHAAALRAAWARRQQPSPTPTAGTASPAALDLRRLAAAEQDAAAAHASASVTAPRDLAPLLGSLAACEHAHGVVLAGLRKRRP